MDMTDAPHTPEPERVTIDRMPCPGCGSTTKYVGDHPGFEELACGYRCQFCWQVVPPEKQLTDLLSAKFPNHREDHISGVVKAVIRERKFVQDPHERLAAHPSPPVPEMIHPGDFDLTEDKIENVGKKAAWLHKTTGVPLDQCIQDCLEEAGAFTDQRPTYEQVEALIQDSFRTAQRGLRDRMVDAGLVQPPKPEPEFSEEEKDAASQND